MPVAELVTMDDQLRILQTLVEAEAITPVSLDLSDPMPFDRAEAIARMLGMMGRSVAWWVGDLLIYSETVFGELMAQIAAATGLSEGTLLNRRWVAERVPKSRRRLDVSFSCHTEVAPLPPKEQRHWLAVASREQLTQRELRARIREASGAAVAGNGSAGGGGGGASPPAAELERVARDLWSLAQADHDGWYRVPGEVMARLAAVIGEED